MLFLIRHARTVQEPAVPVEQWRLDPDGAAALADLARDHPWRDVHHWYSSPEHKARATAAALTDRSPVLLDGLREARRGGWTEDYDGTVRRFFAAPDRPPAPGWETADGAVRRFDDCLRALAERHAGADVAVVTHGLVITLWRAYLRRRPVDIDDWQGLGFPDLIEVAESDWVGPGAGHG